MRNAPLDSRGRLMLEERITPGALTEVTVWLPLLDPVIRSNAPQ